MYRMDLMPLLWYAYLITWATYPDPGVLIESASGCIG